MTNHSYLLQDIVIELYKENDNNYKWKNEPQKYITTTCIPFCYEKDILKKLEQDELEKTIYNNTTITFYNSITCTIKSYTNNNGFTVKELLDIILDFENITRKCDYPYNNYLSFEGIVKLGFQNKWQICWDI